MTNETEHSSRHNLVATVVRRLAIALLAIALLAIPLAGRVLVDGQAALAEAERAAAAGDAAGELRWLGRAARFALPGAKHDDVARERLVARAESAREQGASEQALATWRELRRALLGTRTLGVAWAGHEQQLREANTQIVELMVLEQGAPVDAAQRERWAAELEEDLRPRGRSVLAAACFALFLLASIGFFVLGLDASGRLQPRPALRIGVTLLASLVAWILLI